MPRRAPPIPPAVVRGIAGLAWVQGRLDVALGILIGFHCMLRGCEVLGLRFCDCMHFRDTVVLDLGFTKAGSRKGTREQVTITDRSLTSLFRFFCRECKSSEHLVCMSPCNFRKYYSRLLSFFNLGNEGYTLHSLRRGGAKHFSATLERGRWLSVSSGRMYIAHRKIRPANAGKNTLENAASDNGMCAKQVRLQRSVDNGCQDVANVNALENATSDHAMCPRQEALPNGMCWGMPPSTTKVSEARVAPAQC